MKKSEIPKKNKTGKQSPTLQRAQAAELSRDYNLAVHLYRRLLTNEPDNFDLLSRLAQVYVRSGNDSKALVLYLSLNEKNRANFIVLN
ncbi:MAG: tetratricopeptide repeat protein, partial [Spirochaetales bacterium]